MIDAKDDVEVCIRSTKDDTPFAEYAPKPKKRGNHNDAYIEAVTDQIFGISIRVGPDFDYKGCTHVRVLLSIDNMHTGWCFRKPLAGRGRSEWLDSSKRMVDGEWQNRGYSFGEVLLDPTITMSREEEDSEAEKRGKILVTLTRGHSITRQRTELQGGIPTGTPDMNMRSSKKVAVEKGKSHTLKTVNLGRAVVDPNVQCFTEAKGAKGKMIEFKFLYASRMILELKKIIPILMAPPAELPPPPPIPDTPLADPDTTQQVTETPAVPEGSVQTIDGFRLDMTVDLPNHTTTLDKITPDPDKPATQRPRAAAPSTARPKGKRTQICLDNENNEQSPACQDDEDDEEITPIPAQKCPDQDDEEITPTPAQKCPDQDDEEITIVSSRETGSTGLKREVRDVIDFTADKPAVKKVKREGVEVIDLCSDELQDRKVKMEVGEFMGRRAASVAGFGRVKSEFSGGWGGRVKERARLRLELEGLDIKAEQNLVRRLMELDG
ncbi:hypothetical protein LTS10_010528 [Elasticomyces elasticus]|nr:hypothetical protein LTS10_010528 [Elasticomyces elasticus]